MNNKKMLTKEDGKEHNADRHFWVGTLLLAHKYGWKPEMPRTSYLAPKVHVSAGDAQGISQALERLFATALVDPDRVFPVPLDMGELHQFKEFIAGDGFAVVC